MNDFKSIEIGKFYEEYYNNMPENAKLIKYGDNYEVIDLTSLDKKIRTIDNKFVKILYLSRHKTPKDLIKISLRDGNDVTVTSDHVCMRYNKNHMLESVASKDLKKYDYVQVYDRKNDKEILGEVLETKNLGKTDEFVYDLEVDDDQHVFYANNILVHNSQFINIQCVTNWFRQKYNLPQKINDWSNDDKLKLWDYMEKFIDNKVIPYVQNLLKEKCGCEDTSMMRYSLEYIGDCGIYQAKKNYAVHKILSEGPELVDKIKYTGIELKKNTMPTKTKDFLAKIYENTLSLNWDEKAFRNFIYESYDEFMKLDITDIAQWKGYSTAKKSIGFLQFEKGASGISKACGCYNELLKYYNIESKYDTINVGDKVQFVYIMPNKFGIDALAFKGRWPDEFKKEFRVDYAKMFEKSIISPMKNFMLSMEYQNIDPTQQTLFDVFNF